MSLIKIDREEKFLLDIPEQISYASRSLRRGIYIRCECKDRIVWFDINYKGLPMHICKKLEEFYKKRLL